jgi:DsbC/DsbD-like thiol-disulfide interchange protein
LCDFHDGIPVTADTEPEAVETVGQLAAAGTNVFVISMAGADQDLQTHLQAVAAAGKTATQLFTPTSQGDLAKAFTQIIGATASATCAFKAASKPAVSAKAP